MFHVKQVDECRNCLTYGETGQCVFIAHHKELAHFNCSLQLLAFIGVVLNSYK